MIGTAFLVAAVVGSGIAVVRLAPQEPGLQLLVNSIVTGGVLTALILALQPVSASFNPVVTLVERARGAVGTSEAVTLIGAQFVGGFSGVVAANLMFDASALEFSGQARSGSGLWLGEAIATFGLVLLVFGAMRSDGNEHTALVVGGYIAAAYWFTSSTSFANPAVTVSRMFSDSFAGIQPSSVPVFVVMQLVGTGLAFVAVRYLYPQPTAEQVHQPHTKEAADA